MKSCAVFLFVPAVQSPVGSERSPFPLRGNCQGTACRGRQEVQDTGRLYGRPVLQAGFFYGFFREYSTGISPAASDKQEAEKQQAAPPATKTFSGYFENHKTGRRRIVPDKQNERR